MAKEIPSDNERCTAKSKSTGNRCKNYRKPGQKVCGVHGGEAPQNKRKALERLRSAIDPLTEKKVQTAKDAWEKYEEAKNAGAEEQMAYWMEKFNDRYEEVADRAGPPKVKRSEHTGEDGGTVEMDHVIEAMREARGDS